MKTRQLAGSVAVTADTGEESVSDALQESPDSALSFAAGHFDDPWTTTKKQDVSTIKKLQTHETVRALDMWLTRLHVSSFVLKLNRNAFWLSRDCVLGRSHGLEHNTLDVL